MDDELWDDKVLPHYMKSVFVEAWDTFKVSDGNIIRDRFVKTKLPPLIPTKITTNTQACDAYIQVSSGSRYEQINEISHRKVSPIDVQVTITNYPMFVLQERGSKKIIK